MVRVFIVISLLGIAACVGERPVAMEGKCARIVSLAPSITEMLFELDLGSRVVGVTRYCSWPPEAVSIAKVGGWYDPSPEAIIALKPDTIFHLLEQEAIADRVREAGIATIALPVRRLHDVTAAAHLIGAHCHVEAEARQFATRFTTALALAAASAGTTTRPQVLLVVGRTPGNGPVGSLFVAGRESFHNEILTAAGGTNACGLSLPYPRVSVEGIIAMQPDIIVELATPDTPPLSRDDWQRLENTPAAKKGRIHRLTGDYLFIPGPRAPLIVSDLARIIRQTEGTTP